MITIVEPQHHIVALWGKQQIREKDTYRLMRYVLRIDHENKVLLHNVVTGQLVVVEDEEVTKLSKLPAPYSPWMQPYVSQHYIVPEYYNEHQQVMNLRIILRKLNDGQAQKGAITQYSILPTTVCNARCYYCYEQGVKPVTMSEQTAEDVVQFIVKHSGSKRRVSIQWFGGEPTIASVRIDRICKRLRSEGIDFVSTMISNGYLFDNEMVRRAKDIWNLKSLQISIDGTEQKTNEIKAFVIKNDNPYDRIIQNVGLLIQNEIYVGLRMNFDLDNASDFVPLLTQIKNLYGKSKFLQVYAYPIIGKYVNADGVVHHGSDNWFDEMLLELNSYARLFGLKKPKGELPHLRFESCGAQRDSYIAILPDGNLVKCIEQLDEGKVVGSLKTGVVEDTLVKSWKHFADEDMCRDCIFFPECLKPQDCSGRNRCINGDRHYEFIQAIINAYDNKIRKGW